MGAEHGFACPSRYGPRKGWDMHGSAARQGVCGGGDRDAHRDPDRPSRLASWHLGRRRQGLGSTYSLRSLAAAHPPSKSPPPHPYLREVLAGRDLVLQVPKVDLDHIRLGTGKPLVI